MCQSRYTRADGAVLTRPRWDCKSRNRRRGALSHEQLDGSTFSGELECGWAEHEHPRERKQRKGGTEGAVWRVYDGSSSFRYGHVDVHFQDMQNPSRRHSRGETWHVGYAHACSPEGIRETDHWSLVRYLHIQVQEECETSTSSGLKSVRNTASASGPEAAEEEDETKSPLSFDL